MTDQLATVVSNLLTRVIALEPLAVTDASYASKRWVDFHSDVPYWCNRLASISAPRGPEDLPEYDVTIQMRLVLTYQAGVVREDALDGNAQEKAWTYIPTVLRYFEDNRDLTPLVLDEDEKPLFSQLTHIDASRVRIACPRGLDLQVMPLTRSIFLSVDFELTVPVTVGSEE